MNRMPPTPLTRLDLDSAICGNRKCKKKHDPQLYLKPNCHRDATTQTFYDKSTGNLTVEWAECGKMIVVIKVASTLLDV